MIEAVIYIVLGYAIATLFPMTWLTDLIKRGWTALRAKMSSTP
jgi:hypothetical protein